MSISSEKRKELKKKFDVIREKMAELLRVHRNEYALMRHGEIIEFYSSWQDAYKTGKKFYDDDLFSVQKISDQPVDLGVFSRAFNYR
ncbi:MAG: hypothetical protein GDA39_10060 [Hyphomonadaceae bacterium]|nr:hypothetical protein [Hyphomonadaceae bacterium]